MNETRWVIRGLRLAGLKEFIDYIVDAAASDLKAIEASRLAGEFETFDDYEHAESVIQNRVEIASRAIAQELANFVESELQAVGQTAWLESSHGGPKTLMELGDNWQELRMISDLRISQVMGLIDRYYGISVQELEGWGAVGRLREKVNAFKHRDGIKRWRDSTWGECGIRFPQFEEITVRQAHEAIEAVKRFLMALDQATKTRD